MISATEAIKTVLTNAIDIKTEEINITGALGRILREDIVADRDFPPFDRVAMDGIAINARAWQSGRREFSIEGIQTAGSPQEALRSIDNCIEVMTGAMLPRHTDTVIRYEDIQIKQQMAYVRAAEISAHQNIHVKGTDRKIGEVLIKRGKRLSPAELGVMSTVGKSIVHVAGQLKGAIVSTGDELVEITETPKPYQIRKSNVYALEAAFFEMGHTATRFHIKDEAAALEAQLRKILDDHDMVIMSGGVSKGKKDYVPAVLESLGVQKLFHGVKQRPGKPFWFGMRDQETAVFALPGNPVSAFMCFYRYIKPWIWECYGIDQQPESAVLTDDFDFAPDLTYYLQVRLFEQEGSLHARPVIGKGSGDLANLLEADAFLELPADRSEFKKGELFPVHRFR